MLPTFGDILRVLRKLRVWPIFRRHCEMHQIYRNRTTSKRRLPYSRWIRRPVHVSRTSLYLIVVNIEKSLIDTSSLPKLRRANAYSGLRRLPKFRSENQLFLVYSLLSLLQTYLSLSKSEQGINMKGVEKTPSTPKNQISPQKCQRELEDANDLCSKIWLECNFQVSKTGINVCIIDVSHGNRFYPGIVPKKKANI